MTDQSGVDRSEAWRLAPLLEVGRDEPRWRQRDMADLLAHQLRAPLLFDLGRLGSSNEEMVSELSQCGGPRLSNFADLFKHPTPPLELIKLTKNFAKACDTAPEGQLPTEIATILYYASILVARLRHGCWITELKMRDIRRGIKWALE